MLEGDSCGYELSTDIVLRKIDNTGQYWAFNAVSGDHFCLNETACWLLEQLSAGPRTRAQLLVAVVERYDVGAGRAHGLEKDLQEVLDQFVLEGVVVRKGCGADEEERRETGLREACHQEGGTDEVPA
ncbi:MAG TPA: PqqD family protein [Firmicutes bacterium]|nr:PqqD family protein [Bacillota bacterium]